MIHALISRFLVSLTASELAGADVRRVVFDSSARTREEFPSEYVPTQTHEFPVSGHKWALNDLHPDLPSDWSSYHFLVMEVKSSTSQRFLLRLYTTLPAGCGECASTNSAEASGFAQPCR